MKQQLELIDLGDAMTETKCSTVWGVLFDFLYGQSRHAC
jgi:hypothetical protein